ncbi:Biopolymer transport protein ExbD/TolR [Aquisphaera giovannonii]|uniref:Biopolymer transport protein ExbD/TolR n=1 Tax=Aquisphaera giovannonii TaxID=406548 RepID=A0A5B9W5C9_9BACT|nr:biopolymer transporter ExbD [Aquisphaera giovannonii]QEH35507.1 Biopolymer transport protein ExbD/TolR [Aquisphaera giovannonii]
MANWDVFHADRLELRRDLDDEAVRAAFAAGELRDDDLIRPAGTTTPWARLADFPELLAPPAAPSPPPAAKGPEPTPPAAPPPPQARPVPPDFEEIRPGFGAEAPAPAPPPRQPTELPGSSSSDVAFPVLDEEMPALPTPSPSSADDRRALAALTGWVWDDEEDEDEPEFDEDEDEDEDEADLHAADDGNGSDIEILADEEDLADLPPPRPAAASPAPPPRPLPPTADAPLVSAMDEPADLGPDDLDPHFGRGGRGVGSSSSRLALPVVASRDRDVAGPPGDAEGVDEEEETFSLSRAATEKIEELDLAPMVDVAFQLVLFFMVTATTVLYKTLEIPKPSADAPAGAVAQGRSRSLDDLKDDFILVEIDASGAMKLDREPIEADRANLVELLRRAREKTNRKTMLLSADFATLHRNAVLAYDAANEIGLGIAVAKPAAPQGPAPTLLPGGPRAPGTPAKAQTSAPATPS